MTARGRPGRRPLRAPTALRAARRLLTMAAVVAAAFAAPGAAAASGGSRLSFPDLETQFMCVVCHEPLNVAESPEAFQERQYLRTLIAQGQTVRQIRAAMALAYTPAVLATPPASGFSVLVYVVPPLVVALGIAVVALALLSRRRRRGRAPSGGSPSPGPGLDPADAARLDEELGRFA